LFSERSLKRDKKGKKEINASKIYSPYASLPSGLKITVKTNKTPVIMFHFASKKVKSSLTRHRALALELIPVYRQSACS